MKVSDLAADLEVPASTILDQCQRFGIDASWAGAELSGADVVVLRAELATADPIDLTPADPPTEPVPVPSVAEPEPEVVAAEPEAEAPADEVPADEVPAEEAPVAEPDPAVGAEPDAEPAPASTAMPPTAVGSMPELLDEITPEPGSEPDPEPAVTSRGPGFAMAGNDVGGADSATRRVPPRAEPTKRRLDKGARNSVIALLVAIACFVGSNFVNLAALVALLWLVAAVALVVAVVDGFRGRRQAQTHPERWSGVWVGSIAVVLAIGCLVGLTAAGLAAINDKPAADAPASLGDLKSVQLARWGYQRVNRFANNGWTQPARQAGSCWDLDRSRARDEQRVERTEMSDLTACRTKHMLQVARVFSVSHDADAPYPGADDLRTLGEERCASVATRVAAKNVKFTMDVEYPTEVGWLDGDHDVACVLVTPVRTAPIGT